MRALTSVELGVGEEFHELRSVLRSDMVACWLSVFRRDELGVMALPCRCLAISRKVVGSRSMYSVLILEASWVWSNWSSKKREK